MTETLVFSLVSERNDLAINSGMCVMLCIWLELIDRPTQYGKKWLGSPYFDTRKFLANLTG